MWEFEVERIIFLINVLWIFRMKSLKNISIFAVLIKRPGWQGRASKIARWAIFSEEPDCRGGQFRHPLLPAEFF